MLIEGQHDEKDTRQQKSAGGQSIGHMAKHRAADCTVKPCGGNTRAIISCAFADDIAPNRLEGTIKMRSEEVAIRIEGYEPEPFF